MGMGSKGKYIRYWFAAMLLLAASARPGVARAQTEHDVQVYLSVEEALKEVFPRSEQYITETVRLSAPAQEQAKRVLGRRDLETAYEVVLCYDAAGKFSGYAVITEELGKYQPITFIVGVKPDFSVEKAAVMVYRESRGGEVRTPRFLYQYRGKTYEDPIRINRDIINISGATISVRALNAGVKKVLYVVTNRYRQDAPALTYEAEKATLR